MFVIFCIVNTLFFVKTLSINCLVFSFFFVQITEAVNLQQIKALMCNNEG